MGKCTFIKPWVGPCGEDGDPFCKEHGQIKCRVCGEQATHGCNNTYGLVCGIPLCRTCRCPSIHCTPKVTPESPKGGIKTYKVKIEGYLYLEASSVKEVVRQTEVGDDMDFNQMRQVAVTGIEEVVSGRSQNS